MKKISKIILFVLFLFIGSVKISANTNDSTLTTNYIDNTYAYHYRQGILVSYGKLPFRYQNGKLAYCIQSEAVISTNIYSSTNNWENSGYTNEELKRMELIAHYGYGYEGHNTIKFYMATQELIWLFKDDYVKWTTQYDVNSAEINIDNEKNEIMRLVNSHNTLPSMSGRNYIQPFKTYFSVIDTKNVIDDYEIISELNYKKVGNMITFNLDKFGRHDVKLKSKNQKIEKTILYYANDNSQKMATFGFNDNNEASFNITVENINVRINKRDKNTRDLIKEDEAIFNIYDIDNNLVIESNKTIKGLSSISLKQGTYRLVEVKAPNGYIIGDDIIFEINDDTIVNNNIYDLDVFNEKPNGVLNITKQDENNENLEGVEIGLYDSNFKLINSYITDKNGKIVINDIELGTYFVKEISTVEGHILDENYHEISFKYIDDKTKKIFKELTLINKIIKCDVTYIVTDANKKSIDNVEIEIYNELGKIVYKGKSNKDGKIIIKDLPYGKYTLKQINVPRGYILNDEVIPFSVSSISCLACIKQENKVSIMPVTSTSTDIILPIISIVLVLLGVIYKKYN